MISDYPEILSKTERDSNSNSFIGIKPNNLLLDIKEKCNLCGTYP